MDEWEGIRGIGFCLAGTIGKAVARQARDWGAGLEWTGLDWSGGLDWGVG